MARTLGKVGGVLAAMLLAAFSYSYAGEQDATEAGPKRIVTAASPVTIPIKWVHDVQSSQSLPRYLLLEVRVLESDDSAPYMLGIAFSCKDACGKNGPETVDQIDLGNVSLFPKPRVNETRNVEVAIAEDDIPDHVDGIYVSLKPVICGRGVGNTAVEILNASLKDRP